MPVEVISLLTSSEAGSPALPKASQPLPPPASVANITTFSSDDIFSPLPPARQTGHTNIPKSNGRPNTRTAIDNVWLISDDEDIPSKDARGKEGTSNNGLSSKRRRLDCFETDISNLGGQPNRASTAPLQVSGPRRQSPTAFPHLNVERPVPRRNWLDSDPFASSSPRVVEQPPPKVGNHTAALPSSYLDDNPFVSSPALQRGPQLPKASGRALNIDDIDPFVSSSPARVSGSTKSAQSEVAWDPISSSAPLRVTTDNERGRPSRCFRRTQSEVITLDDSENECPAAQPFSDDELPDITNLAAMKQKFTRRHHPPQASTAAKPARKPKSAGLKTNSAQPKKNSLEIAKEKEEKIAAREAEKERKRLEKERAKGERAQEKVRAAALAEVNKIRTDKKVAAPEMIVDLPTTLDESVKLQAATLLRDLHVDSAPWASPVENVVKWRRKVSSRYNDELGHWEPVPERIDRENYAMVIIPAARFIDLVLGEEDASLESHVLRMKRHFPNDTIIYLLEGLSLWFRKNRNARNSQYVSAVRNGLDPAPDTANAQQQRKRKNGNQQTFIDEEVVETSLLQLQVLHGVLIHHTTASLETARWITVFTQHISTVPYRRQRDEANDAGFCMDTGQVRTGDGPHDTYVRMLQEIARVTAPIAYGIAAEFGTVAKLVKGLEEGGPLRLEKVRKSVNKEGEVSERTVGQAVSRRVSKIFLGRDETSTDI